jgi:hypothetical protein
MYSLVWLAAISKQMPLYRQVTFSKTNNVLVQTYATAGEKTA